MSKRLVAITGDTHIGNAEADFGPWMEERFLPQYQEQRELAARAAEVMKERTSSALIDRGFGQFSPRYVENQQAERHQIAQQLGIAEWDDNEIMAMPMDDDPELRLKMLELDGVVGSIVYPQLGFIFSGTPDPELRWAGIRAFNRWMADFCSHAPERYAGTFALDLGDIDRCVEEAKWARDNDLRGGAFVSGGKPMGLPPFQAPYYAKFFDALEDLGLPMNMHAAFDFISGGNNPFEPLPGQAVLMEVIMRHNFLDKGGPLMNFLAGGVFERHPGLKVVVSETGGSWWAAEIVELLDSVYEQQTTSYDMKGDAALYETFAARFREFPRKPSDYFSTNVFVQGHSHVKDLESMERVGVDNVIWANDFPHCEGSWPHSMEGLLRTAGEVGVSADNMEKFLSLNAARVYGFDLDKLQPIADEIGPELVTA
jgi:predicted TIM-barrel fold metal-dependent hydrolase